MADNFKIQVDADTSKAEAKIDALVNKKREINIETNVDGKSTQKAVDSILNETEKHTKKNPVELGFDTRVFNDNMAQIKSSADGLFRMFAGTNALDFGGNKIRDAISELKELDTTLTEIDKTGNLTNKQLSDLSNKSFDNASKWGALVQDYMSSGETFAQAGFKNLSEMSDLSTMAQVAGNMTAETSTKFIIASDAAWQMQGNVKRLTSVLDGMNMVTNKNALQMTDLANGIRVAGSMLANSGLTEDQTAALIGTGVATTKEAGETVGRGLRTIIMNLRQVKGETEDGELIDDEKLKKAEAACNSVGVSLKTIKDGIVELRNPVDILRDLSEVYNSLDTMDARRARITDDIAGKHRSNILSSILTNFSTYDKMLQDYSQGEGSALNEAMKTADSWQGRLNSLKNQWTEFVSGFVDTDFMKGSVSGLEGIVTLFDNLNDAQLFIPTFLSSMLALRNVFSGKGLTDIGISKDGMGALGKLDVQGSLFGIDFTKIGQWKKHFAEAENELQKWNDSCKDGMTNVEKFGGSFAKENDDFRKYISSVKDGTASLDGYKKSLSEAGIQYQKFSMKSVLANAATGFLVGAGIELALAGAIKIADYLVNGQQRMAEAAESSRSAWESAKSGIESTNQELATTQQRMDELNAKGHLTLTEEAELSKLQMQNSELEKQLKLKQKIEEKQHLQAAQDAREVLNSRSAKNASDDGSSGIVSGIMSMGAKFADSVGLENQFTGGILAMLSGKEVSDGSDAYAILSDKIKQVSEAKKELQDLEDSQNESNYDAVQKEIDKKQSEINDLESVVNSQYTAMEKFASVFYDDIGEYAKGFEEDAKRFEKIQKEYLGMDGSKLANSKEESLNTLFAKKDFNGLKESLMEVANSGDGAFNTIIASTPGLSDAMEKAGISVDELKQHIVALANPNTFNIEEVKKQLTKSFADIGDITNKKEADQYDRRTAAFKRFADKLSNEDLEIFYKYVNENDIDLSQLDAVDLANVFENATKSAQETANAIDTITNKSNDLLTSVNAVKSVLSSQQTGKSISPELYSSDELNDYQSALEYVNGSLQLNEDRVKELTQAKVDEELATNNAAKALKQQDYVKNAEEIDALRKKLQENNLARGETVEGIEAQISGLLDSNSAIVNECSQIDVLNAALRESIGVYQEWLDAQNGSDYGDMFSDSLNAFQRIKDTYNKDSEIYGDFGSKKFDAAVDFLVPDSIDHEDTNAISSYMDSVKRYLTFDKDGNANGMDISRFCQDAVDKGLMVLDEAGENYEIAGQTTMEDFADGMNLALPLVQAFFDEMQLKGGDFDWADEAVQTLGDLAVKASDAADALQAADQFKDMDIQIDVSGLENTEEKVSALDSTIEQMNQVKATPGVDASQIENANAIIQYCIQQKQALNEPAIMSVDTSMVEGEVGNAISLLQQFQQAQNELEIRKAVDVDTSAAESKVSGLASEIQAIDPHITAAFDIDTSSTAGITASIAAIKPKIMVDAGVNEAAIIGYKPENKDAKVKYDKDTSAIDSYKPDSKYATVHYTPNTSMLPSSLPPLTRTVNYIATGAVGGAHGLNGTAHAYGTAMADGSWAAKQGGTTLVGELGREIVVDPQSGRWHTVGDNGAEFTHVPKGAIVFNHRQTEALLERGWVNGRGTALASGTAMVTGGIPVSNTTKKNSSQHSSSSKKSSSKSSNKSTNNNTAAVNKNTDATNKNTEEQKTTIDWIKQAIDNGKNIADSLKGAIEDFEMHWGQNSAIDKMISGLNSYRNTLRSSQNNYMAKANALNIPADYVKKIRAGRMQIEDISDKDLAEKVQKYQDWYNTAKDLGAEIQDINRQIRESHIQKMDNIKDDYDNMNDLLKSFIDYNQAISDYSEDINLVGDSKVLSDNLNQYNQMRAYLVRAEKDLTAELNWLVKQGIVGKNTDTWNKWQAEINGVKESIIDCDSALNELKNNIREIRLNDFNISLDNLDFSSDMSSSIRDLMSEEGIFDDDIKLTQTGYAQLGLLGTELVNAKQKVANYNAVINALKEDLKNGNVTQAQYNEKLKEYQKDQMDAVKATSDAKKAILDIVKNGIQKETEAMEKLIDKRKEALQKEKDAYDWQKKVSDNNKDRNKIIAQLAAMEGDDSAETVAKRKKLNAELQELDDKFDEERRDHEYDSRNDAYDDQLEKYKESQDKVLKELETNLETQNQAIADSLGVLVTNHTDIYDQLKSLAEEYNFTLTDDLISPWKDALVALEEYKKAIGDVNADVSIDTSPIKPSNNPNGNLPNNDKATNQDKSQTGTWLKEGNKWWYQHQDGSYSKNSWEKINGSWYHFDDAGWMQTGWVKDKGKWYYTDNSGAMKTGWQKVNDKWYYMDGSGAMQTGWQTVSGKQYYLDSSGAMKTGWIKDKGKWFFLENSGAMATNKYVQNPSNGTYYWVNAKGEWEPKWDTKNPNLNKYASVTQGGGSGGGGSVSSIGGNLSHGMVNENVGKLQQALKALGYYKGNLDNSFGDQTYAAVKQFQRDNGISADGIVGKDTKAKFKAKGYASGTKNATPGVHQVWENGEELFMDSEGNKFRIFKNNDVVFDHNQTERLWDISKGLEPQPILPNIKSNFSQIVPEQKIGGDVNVKIDSLVGNIEYVDKNALPDLQTILKKSCDYTRTYVIKELGKLGWK